MRHVQSRAATFGASLVAVVACLGVATSASAIVLTGGPTYSPPNGGSCSIGGQIKSAAGGTWTCSVNPANYTNIYIGIKNNNVPAGTSPIGEAMRQNNAPTGAEIFSWSSEAGNQIVYTGQTQIFNAETGSSTTAFTRLTLTFSGTGAIVDDVTTQALSNSNGAVHSLWRIQTGAGFTVVGKLEASDSAGGPWTAALDYFGTPSTHGKNTRDSIDRDFSNLDLGFYYSTCGDSQTDTAGSTPETCDLGSGVNGTATACCAANCQFASSSTVCRAAGGVCDIAEQCTGASATCPANAFSTAVCRGAADECDLAESCPGNANNCPADVKKSSGTSCSSDGNPCTVDECDGSSVACQHPVGNAGATCRAAADVCDVAETCTGLSATCPSDALEPGTTTCRASAGVCDIAEQCTGSSVSCPANAFESSSTVCRASAGVCDPQETCTGSSAPCPADAKSTSVCRAAAGACDLAESCDGVANDCPGDAKSTAECRASAGDCDLAESCDGSSDTCPTDAVRASGFVCNAGSGDSCDPDELCDGSSTACPADTFSSSSTVCRAAAGGCDLVEQCPGTAEGACPADAKAPAATVCRASVDPCDVVEQCDGGSDDCPADGKLPDATSCDDGLYCNGAESCLAGICTGTSPCTFTDICNEATDTCQNTVCPTVPQGGCRTALKNSLLIKNKTFDSRDKLIWKFIKGQATTQADYADPTTTANYALCVYAGTADTLVAAINVPPSNTKWEQLGAIGFKYTDQTVSFDGAQKIILKAGVANKSKALVKGKGANLPDPLDSGALATPVTAQLLNYSSGVCWQGTFTAPSKNTSAMFKAKTP